MKCPNCYNENEDGRATCKYCGAMLPEEPIPVKKVEITEEKKEEGTTNSVESQTRVNNKVEDQDFEIEIEIDEPKEEKKLEYTEQNTQENVENKEALEQREEVQNAQEQVSQIIQQEPENGEKVAEYTPEEVQQQLNEQYQQEVITKQKKVKIKKERRKIDTRKVKKVFIILLILLILIGAIAGGIYYYLSITSPLKVYQKAIQTTLDKTISNPNCDAKSFQLSSKVSLDSPESSSLSRFNGFNLDTTIGMDFGEQSSLLKVKIDKNGEEYIDATALSDIEHRLLYLGESNVYDQYVRIDIPAEYVDQINSIIDFNYLSNRDTAVARNKIRTTLENEINKYISYGTFSRTQASITYNGENKNVRDDVYTITEGGYKHLITNICTDLLKDTEFLKSFGEEENKIEEYLNEVINEVKYLKEDDEVEKPNYIRFHIYTSGFNFDFMGIRAEYNSDFTEEKANILLCKNSDSTYVFNVDVLSNKKERVLVANISRNILEDGTTKLGLEVIYNQQSYKADIEYKYSTNQGIESLDMGRVKKYEDLEEEDYAQITTNFQDLPIYEAIETAITFIQENEYINELLSANVQTELPNNIKLEENQSYLITNNNKVVIYEVPTAFENSYSGNMYKSYRKNNRIGNRADIYLNLISEDTEQLLNEYIKSYDYLTAKEYKTEVDRRGNEYQVEIPSKYKDVSISKIEKETINDIEYSKLTVEYTTDSEGAHSITYYATEFNEDYTFVVRLEDASNIVLDTEMEKILTITKYL